jgi:hypothetical protein
MNASMLLNQGNHAFLIFLNNPVLAIRVGFLSTSLLMGLCGFCFIWCFVLVGNLVSEMKQRTKQKSRQNKAFDKIKNECQEVKQQGINLGIFAHDIFYIANKVTLYSREERGDYVIVINTDIGLLVRKHLDYLRADREFSFICGESEAAHKNLYLSINLFSYSVYENNVKEELISAAGIKAIPETSIAV